MVIIRFVRVGRKNQAFFHLVAAEKYKAVQKKHIEKLGYYNPHFEKGKGELVVLEDRVKHYLSHGAQMSETAARLLTKHGIKEAGKFVNERIAKPKKTPAPTEAPVATEAPVEEAPATEKIVAPAEEVSEAKTEETPVEQESEKPEEKKEEKAE